MEIFFVSREKEKMGHVFFLRAKDKINDREGARQNMQGPVQANRR